MTRDTQPAQRPLTAREREILDFLLAVEVPGVEELRSQADVAVAKPWAVGQASIDLVVDRQRARRSARALSPHLEIAARRRSDLSGCASELFLSVHEGWVESVAIVLRDPREPPPEVFPSPGDFEPPQATRPLTAREREILEFLLSVDMPGVEELRSQVEFAVARRWSDTDASIYLLVDRARAPRAVLPSSSWPHLIEAWSREELSDRIFELQLSAADGWLDMIEIIDVAETGWPDVFPPPGDFAPPTVNRR
jgi:hypothetical protein